MRKWRDYPTATASGYRKCVFTRNFINGSQKLQIYLEIYEMALRIPQHDETHDDNIEARKTAKVLEMCLQIVTGTQRQHRAARSIALFKLRYHPSPPPSKTWFQTLGRTRLADFRFKYVFTTNLFVDVKRGR